MKEIRQIFTEWDSVSSEQVIDFIQTKIDKIEEQINQLQNFKDYLQAKKARIEAENNTQ